MPYEVLTVKNDDEQQVLKFFLKMTKYSATLIQKQKLKYMTDRLKTAAFKPWNLLRQIHKSLKTDWLYYY